MTVTKTSEKAPKENLSKIKHKKAPTSQNIRLKKKTRFEKNDEVIYSFLDFEDICSFAKYCDTFIIHDDTLYKMNEKYYLKTTAIPYHSILDYADIEKNFDLIQARLNEYGKVIIEKDALQTIAKYFNKSKRKTKKSEA